MTTIAWTEETWNPTTGCDRTSAGCDQCYALTMAKRLKAMGSEKYQTDGDPRTSGPGFGVAVHPDTLDLPLHWKRPRRIFVNSMSDLFHQAVPDEYIARVFAVMAVAPQHTFQVLTKRHGRMRSLLNHTAFWVAVRTAASTPERRVTFDDFGSFNHGLGWYLPNVHLGVSVEDQKRAELRIPALLDTPAAVRWLSCEPLLGPVRLTDDWMSGSPSRRTWIDWCVVGGESGRSARPMDLAWARSLRDQCDDFGTPFLFKQTGTVAARELGIPGKGEHLDDLPTDLRIRQYPTEVAA